MSGAQGAPGVAGPDSRPERPRPRFFPLGNNAFDRSWPTLTRVDRVAGDRKLDGTRPPLDAGRDEAARSRRPPRPGGPARGRGVRRRQKKGGDRLVAA